MMSCGEMSCGEMSCDEKHDHYAVDTYMHGYGISHKYFLPPPSGAHAQLLFPTVG